MGNMSSWMMKPKWTRGYTAQKKWLHLASLAVFMALGLTVCIVAGQYADRPNVIRNAGLGVGIVMTILSAMAMMPVLMRPHEPAMTLSQEEELILPAASSSVPTPFSIPPLASSSSRRRRADPGIVLGQPNVRTQYQVVDNPIF